MRIETRWPERYSTPEPELKSHWAWLQLWEVENPNPGGDNPDFQEWYALYHAMSDRCWVATCFPQYAVFDWPEEDVVAARKLLSRHTCSVCGRHDDPGCVIGC